MEERKYQRYTYTHPYDDAYEIVDKKINMAMKPEDVTELLNKQTKHIKDLEDQIEYMAKDYTSEIAFWTGASDKQIAIRELEKLKENCEKAKMDIGLMLDYTTFNKILDKQIENLKGE